MTFSEQFSLFTKAMLPLALTFLAYGYICRMADIYFFWESRSIGWTLLLIGCLGFLIDRIKVKRQFRRKSVLEKVALGLVVLILAMKIVFISVIPVSDAFAATKDYVKNDKQLQAELGAVKGIALFPAGTVLKSSGQDGVSGKATFMMTVIGEKKFKDVTVFVIKSTDSQTWRVDEVD